MQRLSEYIGDWWDGTADTNSTTADVVDTELDDIVASTDSLDGYWVRADPGETDIPEVRRRTSLSLTGPTITVSRAFSSAVTAGDVYTVHRYNPDDKLWAINRAIETAFVDLFLPILDESIKVDNLLTNWDFETFSGGFTGWTEKGTVAVTQETTRVFQGASSAKLVSSATASGLEQNLYTSVNQADMFGKSLFFEMRIWTDTADAARIRITFDGSTFTSSVFHAGNEDWENLTITAPFPANATELTASIEVESGATAYADNSHGRMDRIYRYAFPTGLDRLYRTDVQQQHYQPDGVYIPVNGKPAAGRILRLEGKGELSTVSSDTDTVQIGGRHVDLLIAKAAEHFWQRQFSRTGNVSDRAFRDDARIEYERIKRALRTAPMTAQERQGWHVDETSSGKVLVFEY